jgi:hypothetical protein
MINPLVVIDRTLKTVLGQSLQKMRLVKLGTYPYVPVTCGNIQPNQAHTAAGYIFFKTY